jgi:hypothetical protein
VIRRGCSVATRHAPLEDVEREPIRNVRGLSDAAGIEALAVAVASQVLFA